MQKNPTKEIILTTNQVLEANFQQLNAATEGWSSITQNCILTLMGI